MCDATKNTKGQIIFSLKSENYHLFDPYYYMLPSAMSQGIDVCSELFKKKKFDTIFGEMPVEENDEEVPANLNKLFAERILSPLLLKFIVGILKMKTSTEGMTINAFKLLFTFADLSNEYKNTPKFNSLLQIIEENSDMIFDNIKKHAELNEIQAYSFNRLRNKLIELSPKFSKFSVEMKSLEDQKESKTDIKEKQRKILEEFKKRQEKFMSANITQVGTVQKTQESDKVCSVCGEKLDLEATDDKICGKLIFGDHSMNLLQAKRQTLMGFETMKPAEFKELADIPYIDNTGEGFNIRTCNHYAHISCIKEYQEKENRLLLVLAVPEFLNMLRFCPLCRTAYTWIIPNAVPVAINENITEITGTMFTKIISKYIKTLSIEDLEDINFYQNVFEIIQFNVQKLDLIGIEKCLEIVVYLSSFLLCTTVYAAFKKYNGPEVIKTFKNNLDKSLFADRSRVLMDVMLYEFVKNNRIELLSPEFVKNKIQSEFAFHLYAIMAKIAKEKEAKMTIDSLLEIGHLNKDELILSSMQYVKKAIVIYCLFSNDGKAFLEKVKPVLKEEDPKKLWMTLSSQEMPINFEKALNDTLKGILKEEANGLLEVALKSNASFKCLNLITKPLEFKLIPLEKHYNEMILHHYQKNCYYCDKQFLEKILCLCCGKVICAEFLESNKSLCKDCKGFSEHSMVCQGGTSLYLIMTNGGIVASYMKLNLKLNSPYLTKFGESMTVTKPRDEDYELSDSELENIRSMILNDDLSLLVLQKLMEMFKH